MRECVCDYGRLCERDEIFRERECVHGCLQAFVSECVCVRLCENDKIECRCVRVKENLSICEKERQKEKKKRENERESERVMCVGGFLVERPFNLGSRQQILRKSKSKCRTQNPIDIFFYWDEKKTSLVRQNE